MTNNIIGYEQTFKILGISAEDTAIEFVESYCGNKMFAKFGWAFEEDLRVISARCPSVVIHPIKRSRVYWLDGDSIFNEKRYLPYTGDDGYCEYAVELNDNEEFTVRATGKFYCNERIFVGNLHTHIVDANIQNFAKEVQDLVLSGSRGRWVAFHNLIEKEHVWDRFHGIAYYLTENVIRSMENLYSEKENMLYLDYVPVEYLTEIQTHWLGKLNAVCLKYESGEFLKVVGGEPNKIAIPLSDVEYATLGWLCVRLREIETVPISLSDFEKREAS